jgi:hypothetical protein
MHLHLPRPLHGWRDFMGEVGVIVLGVLVALAFQQSVEWINERREASEARQNVRAEAAFNLSLIQSRVAVQGCIDRRIDEIEAILAAAGPGTMERQPTWIGRPSTGPFFMRRWDAATASGRNSLFTADEQERFAQIYDIFGRFNDYQAREQQVWADLRTLETWHGALGAEARLSFAKNLQQARYLAWDLNFAGQMTLQNLAATGLTVASSEPEVSSICLPIDTPRLDALQRINGPFGEP